MANPILLQDHFRGMWRDNSRDQLPPGFVWDMVDFIPDELGAPLRKRGGWDFFGANFSAGLENAHHVLYAPFSTAYVLASTVQTSSSDIILSWEGPETIADATLFTLASGQLPVATGVFYRDTAIFPGYLNDGTAVATRKATLAGGVADLGGSPPNMRFLAVYKDRLAAASGASAAPNRIYFSAAGNAESWDTTNRYIDTSAPPIALAALPNILLVYHNGSVERIRGDIPPGSAAANMTLEPLFGEVGITEPNALAVSGNFAYWADENGVYRSDGSTLTDLTKKGGISSYWRTQFASVGTSGHVALGVWRGRIVISLTGTSDAFVDFLVHDIDRGTWYRFSGIRAYNFSARYGSEDELYFSKRGGTVEQVGALSPVFEPDASTKNDGEAAAVTPVLETPVYTLGNRNVKSWANILLDYDLRDAATDNPIITPTYITSPEATSYSSFAGSPSTFTETTARAAKRVTFGKKNYGIGLKFAQSNASSDTRIYAIGAGVERKRGWT